MTPIETMARDYAAAWRSLEPAQVAAHYAEDGSIRINRGDVLSGRDAIRDIAAGFHAGFPDLVCTATTSGGRATT